MRYDRRIMIQVKLAILLGLFFMIIGQNWLSVIMFVYGAFCSLLGHLYLNGYLDKYNIGRDEK